MKHSFWFYCCLIGIQGFGQIRPESPVFSIHSTELNVRFYRSSGLPEQFICGKNALQGPNSTTAISVIVCRLAPRAYDTVIVRPSSISITGQQADIFFQVPAGNLTKKIPGSFAGKVLMAASFHLIYRIDGNSLNITLERVKERPGFELIESFMPHLARVSEKSDAAWLAHGYNGGELVALSKAKPYHFPEDDYFGRIGYVSPMAIVGDAHMECVMEVTAFMDGTEISVTGNDHAHEANLGTVQTFRVHAGRAYGLNDGQDPQPGNDQTPNLLVGQIPHCRLTFLADADGNGVVDWLDGAGYLAHHMPPRPTSYYNDRFIYFIAGKYKLENKPRTTFRQSEQLIRDIAELTDGAPQVPLISGWAYDGQDTGFPSEDSVNATLGGYDGLVNLIQRSKKYNANVSLNTNWDDAYRSSPVFDTAFIARRPDGRIWKSRDWAGDTSFVVGMAKFMEKWGVPRVDYLTKHYPIQEALLIDAMSWFGIRNDWDPLHPASGFKNLVEGKYRIIDEFKKRGIYVMSEQLRYPFIGKLSVSADGKGGAPCVFGGQPIPFLSAVYRKSAIWGAGDFSSDDIKQSLFWNARPMNWYSAASDISSIISYYFLTVLPFNKLLDRNLTSYTADGFECEIGFEGNAGVHIDWMKNDYSVRADGVEIAGHYASFCPLDSDRIACFSKTDAELTPTLPAGWNPGSIFAQTLFTDHREKAEAVVTDGIIHVQMKAMHPIIIYRNEIIAKSRGNN